MGKKKTSKTKSPETFSLDDLQAGENRSHHIPKPSSANTNSYNYFSYYFAIFLITKKIHLKELFFIIKVYIKTKSYKIALRTRSFLILIVLG